MYELPITPVLPALCEALQQSNKVVLSSPPGSGKTTLAPLALMEQPWLTGKKILMLEPRRLATRAAAQRMAQLLEERVGDRVGYQIRFERKISAATRIEVVTEGILTRRLQQDPELQDVGLVIFDEFHERNLHADLALSLCLDVITQLRNDLRLLIMSATLDTATISELLGGARVIVGEGQAHPVELRYLERTSAANPDQLMVKGVLRAIGETEGDILAFLPGRAEIRRVERALRQQLAPDLQVLPLYGELSREAQDAALTPHPSGRRVVLATSIAETSLTIEGIRAVVDSGWSRRPRFDPNSGLTRLETVRVSRAAADQRAGRAGRLGPGICYRLWSQAEQTRLPPFHPPELLEADLAPLALELALWGVSAPDQLLWLDPPPAGAYAQAQALLQRMGALDTQGRITPEGRRMVGLALHPRLAHMLLNAADQGDLALDLSALLTERDILKRGSGESLSVDLEARQQRLVAWRLGHHETKGEGIPDPSVCRRVERAVKQWRRLLSQTGLARTGGNLSSGGLLSLAFPDRIAQRRAGSDDRYLLASGRGVKLPAGDPLSRHDYLVVAALDAGRREGRAYLAAPITVEEIRQTQAAQIEHTSRIEWDPATQSVMAREEERLAAVILSSTPLDCEDQTLVCQAMLSGIQQLGLTVLPWSDVHRQWRERVASLRLWQPDQGWPDLTDAALIESLDVWLAPWLKGITRRDQLKQLDLTAILNNLLAWEQQQDLERLAPAFLQLPSGMRRRLHYQAGEPPVLAVKLQELFGLQQTPAVCQGKVAVMLHLLSPAQRPIQVTQDLAGFWKRTYAEVKRELKGRYPKHYWPDDPLTATPTAHLRPSKDK